MNTEENQRLVRRCLDEVVNTGDRTRASEFISPALVEVHENLRHELGIEGARRHILGVRETYPGLRATVEQQVAEGECVATLGLDRLARQAGRERPGNLLLPTLAPLVGSPSLAPPDTPGSAGQNGL